ncbi:MAG TPA: 4-hydroxy-tetrahydrodipicolinate reductase [Deltaproteobacteria bacterium]|nr:4-hydroxy-tetrahydrodipicolinate reductase [Deltaproteobacteria bacterium]
MRVAVIGAGGRMGKALVSAIDENPRTRLTAALERRSHPLLGRDSGETAGTGKNGVKITWSVKRAALRCDVFIDFSSHESSIEHIEEIAASGRPVVIGTTGFSHHQRERIKELSFDIPIVIAPNMSVGVNLLLRLVRDAARVLSDDYDIEIVEAHHRHKKDAPSGTALRLAEVIASTLGRDLDETAVYARKGIIGERTREEIGIQSLRGGDIVGDHTVLFAGPGERIELTHRAHSRNTFATGAVKAAVWVSDKGKGLYDMQDVLELNDD